MIKKTVKYTDYNGDTVTDDFYFNLNKAEIIELENSVDGGMSKRIQQVAESKNNFEVAKIFKEILLLSIGEKSADGKRFVKNDQIRDNFVQTEAYSELFIELATQADKAVEFINGLMPADVLKQVQADAAEVTPNEPMRFEDYSRDELMEMDDAKFVSLVGTDPSKFSQQQLQIAFARKSRS